MTQRYKMRKIFDCQDMSQVLRTQFFGLWDNKGNDTYVEWTISDDTDPPEEYKALDAWLIEGGADGPKTDDECGETVLISYWW